MVVSTPSLCEASELNPRGSSAATHPAAPRWFSGKVIELSFGGALTILAIVSLISYRNLNRLVTDSEWVEHTHEVLKYVHQLRGSLADGERSQLDYVLTGNDNARRRCEEAQEEARTELRRLRELTADNANQQERLDHLEPLVQQKQTAIAESIQHFQSHSANAPEPVELVRANPPLRAKIRSALKEMEDEEQRLLAERTKVNEASDRVTRLVIVTESCLAFLVLAAGLMLQRDVSRRKRMEERLRANEEHFRLQAEELARSNAELQQFAYVTSHDLQEPLRMVSSYVELLARRYQGQLDDKADKYIGYAVDGASRMQTLINDLLAYSRVGTHGKALEPADSGAAVDQALTNLQKTIQEKSANVTRDALPVVRADQTQLVQLFQNLIGNALKFCDNGPPRVHVGVERRGAEWLFRVRDNGIGIAPEHAERIFLIFQRLNIRAKYPGTGIGLAICKKVVKRHGGRIGVESRPGEGSAFFFTLPFKEEPR
jgi:signal transduction histidine kinase